MVVLSNVRAEVSCKVSQLLYVVKTVATTPRDGMKIRENFYEPPRVGGKALLVRRLVLIASWTSAYDVSYKLQLVGVVEEGGGLRGKLDFDILGMLVSTATGTERHKRKSKIPGPSIDNAFF